MKQAIFLIAISIALANSSAAQPSVAVAGFLGFYQPKLDVLDQLLDEMESRGAMTTRSNGNIILGGSFHFSITPRVYMRIDAAKWRDDVTWQMNVLGQTTHSKISVDILPILMGFQFYLKESDNLIRYYFGASVGIIHAKVDVQSDSQTPNIPGTVNRLISSGNNFALRPYLGADFTIISAMKLYTELAYFVGNYEPQDIDFLQSHPGFEALSFNGVSFSGGLKIAF